MTDQEWVGKTMFLIILTSLSLKTPTYPPLSNLLKKYKKKRTATLINHKCEVWHIKFFYNENDDKVYLKGKGWKKFAIDNGLEIGYIIELEYKGSLTFIFRIYDHSTCDKDWVSRPEIAREEKVSRPKKKTMHQKMKERVSMGHKLVLKRTIKRWNYSHGFLRLPAWFAILSGIKRDHDRITIIDPKGKSWKLGLRHPKTSRGVLVSKCFGKFARSSRLKHGSKIELEPATLQASNKIVQLMMRKL